MCVCLSVCAAALPARSRAQPEPFWGLGSAAGACDSAWNSKGHFLSEMLHHVDPEPSWGVCDPKGRWQHHLVGSQGLQLLNECEEQ